MHLQIRRQAAELNLTRRIGGGDQHPEMPRHDNIPLDEAYDGHIQRDPGRIHPTNKGPTGTICSTESINAAQALIKPLAARKMNQAEVKPGSVEA
jgi:hypothetical protein